MHVLCVTAVSLGKCNGWDLNQRQSAYDGTVQTAMHGMLTSFNIIHPMLYVVDSLSLMKLARRCLMASVRHCTHCSALVPSRVLKTYVLLSSVKISKAFGMLRSRRLSVFTLWTLLSSMGSAPGLCCNKKIKRS